LAEKTTPMKNLIVLVLFCFQTFVLSSQTNFSKWFTEGSLRVDYIIAGNHSKSDVFFQSLKKEAFWGGSKTALIDSMNYGEYLCKVFPEGSSELIYSRGFSTLFQEWQTTEEATVISQGFYESTNVPFPLNKIRFEIYEKNKSSEYILKLSVKIDPRDYFIQPAPANCYPVEKIRYSGDPVHCVDIVFVPEGYTKTQMGKFKADIKRLTDSLFTVRPFSNYSSRFNFYAVLAPSAEEGADIPGANIWKNTLVNSSFYTFNSERYLTTLDFWKVKDVAAMAPYDQIYVLVNTDKYGGGGVYNHFNLTSADNSLSPNVFIHEFGHGFAGLGDEYYTSDVSYNDFYTPDSEPWEPNLTTLVDFSSKWKNMILEGTPIPTPPGPEYLNSIGVFEGGGYVAKGVYRPAYDCRMKSNIPHEFCKVCENSIEKMLLFLTL
jgi:hypothetical protein